MIDIHTHILPGVDDGSADLEDSYLMAELAEECGVDTIIATWHCNIRGEFENYWCRELEERLQQLNHFIRGRGGSVQILPGQEIYATEDMAEKIKKGRLISLNHTCYYLVEFGFYKSSAWITRRLGELLELGITPVVAHPERYACVQQELEAAQMWVDMGCQLQVNKGSVFGRFGRPAWRAAGELLYADLVSYMASDAHSPYQRTTWMGDAYEFLCEEFSEQMAHRLLEENPHKLIHSRKSPYFIQNTEEQADGKN